MKSGEKKAFVWIGVTLAAIAILTVVLEIRYQNTQIVDLPPNSNHGAPAQDDNQVIAKTIPNIPMGINPDELPDPESRGATILTLYCAQCHELPTPAMHTKEEWQKIIERMKAIMLSRRSGMLIHTISPPKKDWTILETYLGTHAQTPLDKNGTSGLDTSAGKAFQATCSQCHGAPNPATHTSNEWPRVVLRMKSHIIRSGKNLPDQETLIGIIEYLQSHSKTNQ